MGGFVALSAQSIQTMPFDPLSSGVRRRFLGAIRIARTRITRVWYMLRGDVLLFEYLLPVRLIRQDFRAELARHRSYINEFFKEEGGQEAELHAPSAFDSWMFVVSQYSRGALKLCLTWIIIEFIFAVARPADYHPIFVIGIIVIDLIVLLLMIVLALSNVALYGPTCAGFVVALRLRPSTGSMYRLALNSYPRRDDEEDIQLKRWMHTRLYVKQLARLEAHAKLMNIMSALLTNVLCISLISYLLTSPRAYMPLLQHNGSPLSMQDGIWGHVHFYLVTLATIGYGDMTFVNTGLGRVVGAFMSIFVIAAVLGFVSYINHYIVNFKERIISGLDLEVGSGADWIAKNLRDI